MMYRTGDEFVIRIGEVFTSEQGERRYRIKGFASLMFDDKGLAKLEPLRDRLTAAYDEGYQKGINDGYKLTQCQEVQVVQQNASGTDDIKTATEALQKLNEAVCTFNEACEEFIKEYRGAK